MKEQPSFADLDYQHKGRRTRREEFLERIDSLIPWQKLESRIEPHYFPGSGADGPIRWRRCCGCISSNCATT